MVIQRGHVKFRVRREALKLGSFSIEFLVLVTGLNKESVRTVVQNMKKEGLLTSERRRTGKRGGQEVGYRLTDDPTALRALLDEVGGLNTPIANSVTVLERAKLNRLNREIAILKRQLTKIKSFMKGMLVTMTPLMEDVLEIIRKASEKIKE